MLKDRVVTCIAQSLKLPLSNKLLLLFFKQNHDYLITIKIASCSYFSRHDAKNAFMVVDSMIVMLRTCEINVYNGSAL